MQFFEAYPCCYNSYYFTEKTKKSLHTFSTFVINHTDYNIYVGLQLHQLLALMIFVFSYCHLPFFIFRLYPISIISTTDLSLSSGSSVHCPLINLSPPSGNPKPEEDKWLASHLSPEKNNPTLQISASIYLCFLTSPGLSVMLNHPSKLLPIPILQRNCFKHYLPLSLFSTENLSFKFTEQTEMLNFLPPLSYLISYLLKGAMFYRNDNHTLFSFRYISPLYLIFSHNLFPGSFHWLLEHTWLFLLVNVSSQDLT